VQANTALVVSSAQAGVLAGASCSPGKTLDAIWVSDPTNGSLVLNDLHRNEVPTATELVVGGEIRLVLVACGYRSILLRTRRAGRLFRSASACLDDSFLADEGFL
jgi:hypothetical protein